MKIRFLQNTNIRRVPTSQNNQPIGVIYQGAVIEVTPVDGDTHGGSAVWYADQNGWCYWGGMAEPVEDSAPVAPAPAPPPTPAPPAPVEITSTVPPQFEAPLHDPLPPPNDAAWMRGNIPEGETRPAPSLEELEAMAAGNTPNQGAAPPDPAPARSQATTPPSAEHEAFTSGQPELNAAAPERDKLNWALQQHRIAETWWEREYRGEGMRIAILGTGMAPDHPDLEHIRDTFTFPMSGAATYDAHGIGIQCAVIAAGAGKILYGVAPEAHLLIAKIGEQPLLITPDGLIAGMNWALESGAEVILTLAEIPALSSVQRSRLEELTADALSRRIPVISPVGVSLARQSIRRFPAALEGVLSVGAHDQFEKRCNFSAIGDSLDLLAPAAGLNFSMPGKPPLPVTRSTAIAAAYTAGIAALVIQWHRQNGLILDAQALYALLRDTAVPKAIREAAADPEYGAGLLNPEAIWQKLAKA